MITTDDINETQESVILTLARIAALLRLPEMSIDEFDDDIGHRLAVLDDAIADLAEQHGVSDLDALVPVDEVKAAVATFEMPDTQYSHLVETIRTGRLAR